MKCLHPILQKDKFGYLYTHPCGQCLACRLNYAREWSIRALHESMLWKDNVFLTCTYDDEHLPVDKSVHVDVAQKLMKRIREYSDSPFIRFMLSGEYGERSKRPHYHILLFNVSKDDKLFSHLNYSRLAKGYWCDCSAWKYGHCFLGDVTVDSANYVAGYVVKKQKGEHAEEFYKNLGVDPEVFLTSRGGKNNCFGIDFGGLGKMYALKHFNADTEICMCKGKTYPLPRYYKDLLSDYKQLYKELHKKNCLSVKDMLIESEEFRRLHSYNCFRNSFLYGEAKKEEIDYCIKKGCPSDFLSVETYLENEHKQFVINYNARHKLYNGVRLDV